IELEHNIEIIYSQEEHDELIKRDGYVVILYTKDPGTNASAIEEVYELHNALGKYINDNSNREDVRFAMFVKSPTGHQTISIYKNGVFKHHILGFS
ncbi:hypothetical protein GGI19_006891, partial [Coemansia pectinata]